MDFFFFAMWPDATNSSFTFVWDVRTKRITYESVPTVDGIVGIANYGPTATLFTLGRNHTVQQYDLNPNAKAPLLVQNVQHVPANLPPSPPTSDGDQGNKAAAVTAGVAADPRPIYFEAESSGEEGVMTMSPLQRIAREMDELEDEKRDQLGALSPVSSKSSMSSRSASGAYMPWTARQHRNRSSSRGKVASHPFFNEKPPSPGRASTASYGTGTTFSSGAHRGVMPRNARESISIRTTTSGSSVQRSSRLRTEIQVSPDTPTSVAVDLFPYIKARLSEVKFQPPTYDKDQLTPDDLRRQMLRVVFGWHGDAEDLIRDELLRHPVGSASAVLLSKWLGDLADDVAASMVSSESMTSSDWMLLALSSMGSESQKKVGEAFVDRLLAKGDIHPAVTILLGLGEYDEAVEAYVSRKYFMEAVLLVCLVFPLDWGRQSHLVRRWGEQVVSEEPRQPELAVRCFSCTSIESSEPWFSPRAQDAIYAAQQAILGPNTPTSFSPTTSPLQSTKEGRLHPSQAGLKLVTNFTQEQNIDPLTVIDDKTPMTYLTGGVTPIDSAVLSPGGVPHTRFRGDTASARTATPGGYGRRRYPSQDAVGRVKRAEGLTSVDESDASVPMTAFQQAQNISFHRTRSASTGQSSSRTLNLPSATLTSATSYLSADTGSSKGKNLPSPAHGIFTRLSEANAARNGSRDRKPDGLQLHMNEIVMVDSPLLPGTATTQSTLLSDGVTGTDTSAPTVSTRASRRSAQSADAELKISKIRSIDEYINSLQVVQNYQRPAPRSSSKHRASSRDGKSLAPAQRAPSETRGRTGIRYVKAAKRSPSSPVSMSPDDPALMVKKDGTDEFQDERYYKLVAPVEAQTSQTRDRSEARIPVGGSTRATSRSRRAESVERRGTKMRSTSRPANKASSAKPPSRQQSDEHEAVGETRGRSKVRRETSTVRSPSGFASKSSPEKANDEGERGTSRRRRERGASASRTRSPDRRLSERSRSARERLSDVREDPTREPPARKESKPEIAKIVTDLSDVSLLSKKELAAQELEARRLSLARRPSAPTIPHPDEFTYPKSAVELGSSPSWDIPNERQLMWNTAIDPDEQLKVVASTSGVSTFSAPIGLPATPRAMRHPKYMHSPGEQDMPELPDIPQELANLTAVPEQPPDEPPMILPATIFNPTRSASVPADKFYSSAGSSTLLRPVSRRDSENVHSQKPSVEIKAIHPPGSSTSPAQSPIVGTIGETLAGQSPIVGTIGETLAGQSSIVVVEASPRSAPQPAVLPELQHLAGPPPPPPPPTIFKPGHASSLSLGKIDAADIRHPTPAPMTLLHQRQTTPVVEQQPPNPTSSPNVSHRRGRGSVSDSVSQKLRNVTQRLRDRSASRNRAISPPIAQSSHQTPAPYESIKTVEFQRVASPPTTQRPASSSSGRVLMPYESGYVPPMIEVAESSTKEPPPEPLPTTTYTGYRNPKDIARAITQEQMQFGEAVTAATSGGSGTGTRIRSVTPFSGYRDPKEIRANMPPEQLQLGANPVPGSGNGKT